MTSNPALGSAINTIAKLSTEIQTRKDRLLVFQEQIQRIYFNSGILVEKKLLSHKRGARLLRSECILSSVSVPNEENSVIRQQRIGEPEHSAQSDEPKKQNDPKPAHGLPCYGSTCMNFHSNHDYFPTL
jgi:hypothetical protein